VSGLGTDEDGNSIVHPFLRRTSSSLLAFRHDADSPGQDVRVLVTIPLYSLPSFSLLLFSISSFQSVIFSDVGFRRGELGVRNGRFFPTGSSSPLPQTPSPSEVPTFFDPGPSACKWLLATSWIFIAPFLTLSFPHPPFFSDSCVFPLPPALYFFRISLSWSPHPCNIFSIRSFFFCRPFLPTPLVALRRSFPNTQSNVPRVAVVEKLSCSSHV